MRATCAWCAEPEPAAEAGLAGTRSHGLCAPCLAARLEALRALAPPADRALRAPTGTIADVPERDAA
jgi:hypothetical protein